MYVVKNIINTNNNRDIVIDLSYVEIIDNLLVEKLINFQKYCEKKDCSVSLCGISHDMLSVFLILRLDKYFEFYENEKEAFLRENRFVKRRLKVV